MTRRLILTLAALVVGSAFAAAHPGHQHKVMGVVSMVHENHLEVKDADGKAATFTLSDKTRIRRGKTILTAADIKVGDRVIVVSEEKKDSAGKATLTVVEVQLGASTSSPAN